MIQRLIRVTLTVRDQNEALRFYTEKLGFRKAADMPMGPGMRWLTVAPQESDEVEIVLQPPDWFQGEARAEIESRIGHNPPMVFRVDDCLRTCALLKAEGVEISTPPERQMWGVQAVAKDLYGNDLVLLEVPGSPIPG